MLAVVNQPRMRNTEPVSFKVVGKNIPKFVLMFLESAFPQSVQVEMDEDDNGSTKLEDWDWYKSINASMTPGDAVKADRGLRAWTQKQLAEKLGVSVQNVSEIERNVRPVSRKMAVKLGKVFKTDPSAYFDFGKE